MTVSAFLIFKGGTKANPTYETIHDHTEALMIEFDPTLTSYEDLILAWSHMHSPVGKTRCQYRSCIWYLSEEQQDIAEQVIRSMKAASREELGTTTEMATNFYQAEEYHQDFLNKSAGQS
jgi:methionine-S-sulfoxide reductase